MAKFRFNPESKRRLNARMQTVAARKKKQLASALAMWADDTVGMIQGEINDVGAVDQGLLMDSTRRTAPAMFGTKLRVTVFNNMEYASVIEFGRRPRSGKPPPLLPLVGWAGRKGIISGVPRNISFGGEWEKAWAASGAIVRNMRRGSKKGGKSKPLDPVVHALLIVRLIARKIFEKGFAGRHPFSITIDRRARTFRSDIAAAVRLLK